jgi:putative ABC transport system permease protein
MTALARRRGGNAFQVVSFGLAFMVMLALVLVRSSLLEEWQLQIPENTPNHFVVNISDNDLAPMQAFFADNGIKDAGLFPMVRGRLLTVNDTPLAEIEGINAQVGSVNREMNLSWATDLPSDNVLLEGQWHNGEAGGGISVEQGFADEFKLKIGDTLKFDIGSLILEAPITSVRELDWNSMRPNFYLLLPRPSLEGYPKTYITSFYLPSELKPLLNTLVRQFPTTVLIEVDAVIKQVRSIIQQVSSAIELVLALGGFCALLVTVANVRASLDTRLHENAILRSFGAPRRLIAGGLFIEFAAIGFLAGGLAVIGAELAVWLVQVELLKLNGSLHLWAWFTVPVVAALIIGVSGYVACRRVVQSPPMDVLREV